MGVKFGLVRVIQSARRLVAGGWRNVITGDPGGGRNLTLRHVAPPGDDSPPLPGDFAVRVPLARSGTYAAVGYEDPQNAGAAAPGERRLYSRAPDGTIVAEAVLHGDGSVTITGGGGSFEMQADGSFSWDNGAGSVAVQPDGVINLNGLTIDTDGNLHTPGTIESDDEVLVGDITLTGHVHPYYWLVLAGADDTSPPVPGP